MVTVATIGGMRRDFAAALKESQCEEGVGIWVLHLGIEGIDWGSGCGRRHC